MNWCPQAARIAVLVNPDDVTITEPTLRDAEAAARTMGLQVKVLNANTSREINAAFETMAREEARCPSRRDLSLC